MWKNQALRTQTGPANLITISLIALGSSLFLLNNNNSVPVVCVDGKSVENILYVNVFLLFRV